MTARALGLLVLTLLLGGCLTAYQPQGATGGYTDRKVDENTYFVSFSGNGFTPRERVFKSWLYRCAEVTVQNGYDNFSFIGTNPPRSGRLDTPPAFAALLPAGVAEPAASAPVYIPVYTGGGSVRYTARGYIRLSRGEPRDPYPIAFVARKVLDDLGREVREAGDGTAVATAASKDYHPDTIAARARELLKDGDAAAGRPTTLDDLRDLLPDSPEK